MLSTVIWIFAFLLHHGRSTSPAEPQIQHIVNGDKVSGDNYPWMVSLVFEYQEDGLIPQCGGSLIHREPITIVTAAHCVDMIRENGGTLEVSEGDEWVAVNLIADFGRTHTDQETISIHDTFVDITALDMIHIHESWSRKDLVGDIAIIMVDTQSPLPSDYPVIGIPSAMSSETSCCSDREPLEVIGYGSDDDGLDDTLTLEHINMVYRNASECEALTEKSGSDESFRPSSYQICVTGDNVDACSGDSGGPLFRKLKNGGLELLGAVSFGTGPEGDQCNTQHPDGHYRHVTPTVFTSVGHYVDFIRDVVCGNQKDGDFCQKLQKDLAPDEETASPATPIDAKKDGFWSSTNIGIIAGVSVALAISVAVVTVLLYSRSRGSVQPQQVVYVQPVQQPPNDGQRHVEAEDDIDEERSSKAKESVKPQGTDMEEKYDDEDGNPVDLERASEEQRMIPDPTGS